MPTVLIIGGGIGGLSLAHGILKNNNNHENKIKFDIKIFERDAGPKGCSLLLNSTFFKKKKINNDK